MRKVLVSLLFSIILNVGLADVKFHSVNEIHGLSLRGANSICQDKDGFLWASFRTSVLRFTESDYRRYELPFSATDVISVTLFYENDRLYAYTNNGQVFGYDEVYDRFDLLTDVRHELEYTYFSITGARIDRQGRCWIAASNGLHLFEGDSVRRAGLDELEVVHLASVGNDNLLPITSEGIYRLNTENAETTLLMPFSSSASCSYFDPKSDLLWLGTLSGELLTYSPQQNTLTKIRIKGFPEQPVLAIEANTDSTLLVGIDGQGVWEIARNGQQVLNIYKEDIDNPSSLPGDGVYDIFCDNNDRVWVATYSGGLSFFDQKPPLVNHIRHQINNPNSLGNNYVNNILEDRRGDIWFGTNNGISRWKAGSNQWHCYYQNKHEQAQVFMTICEDNDGNIWAGTYSSGLYILDGKTGQELRHFAHDSGSDEVSIRFVFDIFKDSEGDIWIGGTHSNVLCFLYREKRFRTYNYQPVRMFGELSPGKILMVCSYGLVLLDKETGQEEILLNGYLGQDLLVIDRDIWLGTGGDGLIRYNYDDKSTEFFRVENGLLSDFVNSIAYANGYLWLGTESGLCRFDPDDRSVVTYSSHVSLSNMPFNVNAETRLRNGDLLLGTSNGALLFDPNMMYQTQPQGKIYIQDIGVSGRSIRENEALIRNTPVDRQCELSLRYFQNNLTFELLPLGTSSAGSKFSWKLAGLDTQWSTPADLQTITYTNLPSGSYRLQIRMFDNNLSRIIDERSLKIDIVPPFWGAWWFRALGILLLIGIVSFTLKTYINRMRRKYTEEKIQFFANTAHDIRTSLTLISAPVDELAKDGTMGEKSRYFVNLIAEQSGRLSSVATQLLDFQKVDIGKGQLFPVMTDIVELVAGRISMFESVARKKQVTLRFSPEQPSYTTAVDVLKMEKTVDNLISNAIKYSHPGDPVEIALACDKKKWSLEVRDHGIGISERARKKLFREFYRGDNAANSKMVGSGIGLLLAKNYITMHKGQISVSSKVDAGSVFRVTIPYRLVEETAQPSLTTVNAGNDTETRIEEPIPTPSTEKTPPAERHSHILVVEDNLDLQRFLRHALQEQYRVSVAGNGAEAWEIIQKRVPDLVISDVMMPEMDGFELCRLVKSTFETSHIPVILLTTLSEKTKQLEGLGLGAEDYVTKPFDMSLLSQRIKTIVRNREIVREKAGRLLHQPETEEPVLANELNDRFVKKAVDTVRENITNCDFGKDEFASAMHVSASLLYKKIKALTGQSPVDFIKTIRLDHAMELLRTHKYTVTEVSELCGFSSAGYFSTVFKKHFGKPPTELKG